MIEITQGDILTASAEALVNAVNCVGVMGWGIALQFRKALPESFEAYEVACERGKVKPGRILAFDTGPLQVPSTLSTSQRRGIGRERAEWRIPGPSWHDEPHSKIIPFIPLRTAAKTDHEESMSWFPGCHTVSKLLD
jgi:hypothetical protein